MFNIPFCQSSKRLCIYLILFLCLICLMMTACTMRLTAPGVNPGVYGKLYKPKSPGVYPAVILLHGSVGIQPADHSLAKYLTKNGYVALVLNYFAEVGLHELAKWHKYPLWADSVVSGIEYLGRLPEVQGDHIGLIGFSRGGELALFTAMTKGSSNIKAIVDYYGGTGMLRQMDLKNSPPVLILHGDADPIVSISRSIVLKNKLEYIGKTVELHIYKGAGHGFNRSTSRSYHYPAAKDAQKRTLAFLDKYLKNK